MASVCLSGDKRGNKGLDSGNRWKTRVKMKAGVIWVSVERIDLFVFARGELVCWPQSQQKCWGIGCVESRCTERLWITQMEHFWSIHQLQPTKKVCWCCPLVGLLRYCIRTLEVIFKIFLNTQTKMKNNTYHTIKRIILQITLLQELHSMGSGKYKQSCSFC